MNIPRLITAALRGGSGKTIITIGIIAAWKKLGKTVAPFKKGPDYIDAGWLALSAGRPCHNLDSFMFSRDQIVNSFYTYSQSTDIAIIEGNRGLYDGIDLEGETSTAELAKLLDAPVVFCIDCTKSTRTMAAVVSGCMAFDPEIGIKGVILNRVAGSRHESILRRSIEHHCGIPVVGALPKLKGKMFPERHMGLVPTPEHELSAGSVRAAAQTAIKYIDLTALEGFAGKVAKTPPLKPEETDSPKSYEIFPGVDEIEKEVSIGVVRDSAFQFYYPENIEALRMAGAKIVDISPLATDTIPPVSGLYIGGGFPETHAALLADNVKFKNRLKELTDKGMPVYAECGGLMYLGEALVLEGKRFEMAGVLPVVFGFSKKPQGHGYTVVTVDKQNPYFAKGDTLHGHEFHYSYVLDFSGEKSDFVFKMNRGTGIVDGLDGLMTGNVLATYTHTHALGQKYWAKNLVEAARKWEGDQKGGF